MTGSVYMPVGNRGKARGLFIGLFCLYGEKFTQELATRRPGYSSRLPLPFCSKFTINPALDSSIMPVGDERGRPKWVHRFQYYVTSQKVDAHVPTNTNLDCARGALVYGFPWNVEMDANL